MALGAFALATATVAPARADVVVGGGKAAGGESFCTFKYESSVRPDQRLDVHAVGLCDPAYSVHVTATIMDQTPNAPQPVLVPSPCEAAAAQADAYERRPLASAVTCSLPHTAVRHLYDVTFRFVAQVDYAGFVDEGTGVEPFVEAVQKLGDCDVLGTDTVVCTYHQRVVRANPSVP